MRAASMRHAPRSRGGQDGLALFAVGAYKSLATVGHWLLGVVEMSAIGWLIGALSNPTLVGGLWRGDAAGRAVGAKLRMAVVAVP